MAGAELGFSDCGNYAVVTLRGELDVASAASAAAAVTAAGEHVIVDLAMVEFIDCCALAALLGAREQARLAGGDVLLAAPREPIVLRLLDLAGVRGVYASVPAAASTGRGRPTTSQHAGGRAPPARTARPSVGAHRDTAALTRPYARTGC